MLHRHPRPAQLTSSNGQGRHNSRWAFGVVALVLFWSQRHLDLALECRTLQRPLAYLASHVQKIMATAGR